MILLELFWLCFRTSLISFGGVYGALPELQRLFVIERGWLTSDQLIQNYVVGQLVPGPNMVVCTLIGLHVAGIPGAIAASVGTYSAPILLISAAAHAFRRFYGSTWVRRLEVALRPLVIAFMAAALLTIVREQLSSRPLATLLVAVFAGALYARRILGPVPLLAVSGAAFALVCLALRGW